MSTDDYWHNYNNFLANKKGQESRGGHWPKNSFSSWKNNITVTCDKKQTAVEVEVGTIFEKNMFYP